jgi:folate-binding protein YgfZ
MSSADEYRAIRQGAGITDVTASRARLLLTGADRRSYLQGLLTNDILALTPGTGCYAAYLTPQGRMIADMRLFELGDGLLVDLDASVAGPVRSRWEMFVFSEDVRIDDRSAATAQLAIYGPRAAEVLSAALQGDGLTADSSARQMDSMPLYASARRGFGQDSVILLRTDEPGVPGFELVVPSAAAGALTAAILAAGALTVNSDALEVCRIESGRPRFGVDMTADTIPLEAGIEDRAISLTKGCYVGQEIIIRVLHRGHGRVARRLVGLAISASEVVPPHGTAVHAADREVGTVTSAVRSPALGHVIALAYLHRDFTTPGTVVHVNEAPATVAAVPFV